MTEHARREASKKREPAAQPLSCLPEIDCSRPVNCGVAYFALGCFYGPEAEFGALEGVVETRVGYAGGRYEQPSYTNMRDHSETVELLYNPELITYRELCTLFWHAHNPGWAGVLRQYANQLFFTSEEEREIAEEEAEARRVEAGAKIRTPIRELPAFYPAEASHQKHHLRSHRELMSAFRSIFPSEVAFTTSTAAMRVNAALAGYSTTELIQRELPGYGLPSLVRERVLLLV